EKATNAQNAGAVGLVIANNDTQSPDSILSGLSGFDNSVTIGVGLVSYNAGVDLKALTGPTVRLVAYPNQDGGLDSELVAHEWGHYLFGRLTPDGSGSNQRSSINEGNSDFVALLMSVRAEQQMQAGNDQFQGSYPLVTYAGRRYEFGIRRYP